VQQPTEQYPQIEEGDEHYKAFVAAAALRTTTEFVKQFGTIPLREPHDSILHQLEGLYASRAGKRAVRHLDHALYGNSPYPFQLSKFAENHDTKLGISTKPLELHRLIDERGNAKPIYTVVPSSAFESQNRKSGIIPSSQLPELSARSHLGQINEQMRRLILRLIFNDYDITKNVVWCGQVISGSLAKGVDEQMRKYNPDSMDDIMLTWLYGESKDPHAKQEMWFQKIINMPQEQLSKTNLLADPDVGAHLARLPSLAHMSDGWLASLTELIGDPNNTADKKQFLRQREMVQKVFDSLDFYCRNKYKRQGPQTTSTIPTGSVIVKLDSKRTFDHFQSIGLNDYSKNPETTLIFPYVPHDYIIGLFVAPNNQELLNSLQKEYGDIDVGTWDTISPNQFAGEKTPEHAHELGPDFWVKGFHKTQSERQKIWNQSAIRGETFPLYPFAQSDGAVRDTYFREELSEHARLTRKLQFST
jgi:hypothetical protein